MITTTIERIARESYGKLVAILSSRTGDIQSSQDALQWAFAQALATWEENGIPERPEAWFLRVARNFLRDLARHQTVVARALEEVLLLLDERAAASGVLLEDKRLDLLFVCAHPAIDPAVRPALMLQTVLGLTAAEIAGLYVTSPAALEKRLTRSKQKIKQAGISFSLPEEETFAERVTDVLAAVYAAFQYHRIEGDSEESPNHNSIDDAVILARLLAHRLPDHPEVLGLLSLMLFCQARSNAASAAGAGFVPLDQQDIASWNTVLLEEAETLLRRASVQKSSGKFQLEAAIQSAHCARLLHRINTWNDIVNLYRALLTSSYSVGAEVGYYSALSNIIPPQGALEALVKATTGTHLSYQPYWALRAHLLARCGEHASAYSAYTTAIGLTVNSSVRNYLIIRRADSERQLVT